MRLRKIFLSWLPGLLVFTLPSGIAFAGDYHVFYSGYGGYHHGHYKSHYRNYRPGGIHYIYPRRRTIRRQYYGNLYPHGNGQYHHSHHGNRHYRIIH